MDSDEIENSESEQSNCTNSNLDEDSDDMSYRRKCKLTLYAWDTKNLEERKICYELKQ